MPSRATGAAGAAPADGRADRRTSLGLLALALIWGANFSVIKVALEELSPLAFNALRFPLAAALLFAILRTRPGPLLPSRRDLPALVGLGVLGNVLYQLLFIYGMDLTLAGNASLILASTPVWTILLSFLIGHERPSPLVWAGILGTLLGMGLVVAGGGELRLGGASVAGDLLMVGAAVGWSLYTVGCRNLIRRYGPLRVTAWTLWVGALGLVVLGLPDLVRRPPTGVSGAAWAGVVYAGFLAISVAYLLWYRGVARLGSARTAVYSNLVPVVALGVAWLWLGERPSALQLAGAAVILGGVSLARLGTSLQHP